jgi:hypothetical protein
VGSSSPRFDSNSSSRNSNCSICRCSFSDFPTKLHAVQFDQQQLQMFDLPLSRQQLLILGDQLLVLRQDQHAQFLSRKHVQIGERVHRHARSIA